MKIRSMLDATCTTIFDELNSRISEISNHNPKDIRANGGYHPLTIETCYR
eukprot:UN04746